MEKGSVPASLKSEERKKKDSEPTELGPLRYGGGAGEECWGGVKLAVKAGE